VQIKAIKRVSTKARKIRVWRCSLLLAGIRRCPRVFAGIRWYSLEIRWYQPLLAVLAGIRTFLLALSGIRWNSHVLTGTLWNSLELAGMTVLLLSLDPTTRQFGKFIIIVRTQYNNPLFQEA
jgi:hypothetical protein